MNDAINEQAIAINPSLRQRLKWKLFPSASKPLNEKDKRTYITTDIWCRVDWKDRIRLLILGSFRMQIITYTDVEVKEADSLSVFSIE